MRTPSKQQGMTMLSWLAIIMMVGIIGTAALKLVPVYMEYYSIVSILENMQKDKALKDATKPMLATTFTKRTDINGVTSLKKGDYTITKVEGKKGMGVRQGRRDASPVHRTTTGG